MERAPEVIRSRANPFVRRLRALKKERAEGEPALIEGVRLLEEATRAGAEVLEVAVTPRALAAPRSRRVVDAARAGGAAVRIVDESVLASLSEVETSQGVVALARRPAVDERHVFLGTPLVIVAFGIQVPGNLGGLLRSAAAAGATGAYLTAGTADPFSWKALRGSMGAAFRLPLIRGLTAAEVLARLGRRGLATLALDPRGGSPYPEADMRGPLALLLGGEGAGLPEEAAAGATLRVRIPMARGVESLNVAAAAAVVLFEAARQRGLAQ